VRPSDTASAGMPSRGIGAVCQKSDPKQSDAFSSRINSPSRDATFNDAGMGAGSFRVRAGGGVGGLDRPRCQ
jgi:hypothetical protein